MKNEEKLIKILERFRDKLSSKEIALIDGLVEVPKTIKDSWDSSDTSYKLFTDGASQLEKWPRYSVFFC